jgi:hypothetical protein
MGEVSLADPRNQAALSLVSPSVASSDWLPNLMSYSLACDPDWFTSLWVRCIKWYRGTFDWLPASKSGAVTLAQDGVVTTSLWLLKMAKSQ